MKGNADCWDLKFLKILTLKIAIILQYGYQWLKKNHSLFLVWLCFCSLASPEAFVWRHSSPQLKKRLMWANRKGPQAFSAHITFNMQSFLPLDHKSLSWVFFPWISYSCFILIIPAICNRNHDKQSHITLSHHSVG